VQRSPGPAVQAFDVRPADVREPQAAARPGHADLAGVQMAGENEIERTRRQPVDNAWEVAEQDPKIGLGVGEPLRPRQLALVRARVHADDLHAPAAQLDRARVVREERGRLDVDYLGRV
jgi:hypothetical protein